MRDSDESAKDLLRRLRELEDVPTDDILNMAFTYHQYYPDREGQNMYVLVWAERVAKGQQ